MNMVRKKLQLFLSGKRSYIDRIIGSAPLVYFPLNETAGATAINYGTLGSAANGAYTGVDLADTPAPGGGRAPFYDGVNDFVNIYSTALRDAFDGNEGSMMIWVRVANAGVWTNGRYAHCIYLEADINNRVRIGKRDLNNTTGALLNSGGIAKITIFNTSSTAWLNLITTYSLSAGATGEMKAYLNGIQQGATIDNLGTWVGLLSSTNCYIATENTIIAWPWHGWLAHGAVWDRALAPAEVARLAAV